MGGSIGFTLREENKTEHRMCRWTNVMPTLLSSMDFINKDPKNYKDFLETWYEMVNDYKLHLEGEKPLPKITMVDVYAPYPFLAPTGYGLVLVDYVSNTIISSQGYCGFGKLDYTKIYLVYDGDIYGHDPESRKYAKEECEQYKSLFDNERIISFRSYDHELQKEVITNKIFSWNDFEEMVKASEGTSNYGSFKIDMSPWTLYNYETTPEDIDKMKNHILQLGFVLTEEEEKIWKEWKDMYSEEEEEDENEEKTDSTTQKDE